MTKCRMLDLLTPVVGYTEFGVLEGHPSSVQGE